MQNCSFTGHRAIPSNEVAALTRALAYKMIALYGEGCRNFYSGGAIGFDLLAATMVLRMRKKYPDVRLHMVLPHKGQERYFSDADAALYREVLAAADSIEYVSEHYFDGVMKKRNERLVALCDACICYVTRFRSGAAQTMRMAERAGKPLYNLAKELGYTDF